MAALEGRVAIVTGAGQGLGREHALLFAAEGAYVVVNDVGPGLAHAVVEEITAAGGRAIAHTDSVSDWSAAEGLVEAAVQGFGDLHVVVNNAGILRDRMLVNMTEEEFDSVVDVNLKGTFAVGHFAARYWREQSKLGHDVDRALINTSSGAGMQPGVGQTNYAAAKAGIAAMTQVWSKELKRVGVRVNGIAPFARTQTTQATPGLVERLAETESDPDFDPYHPGNISPLVAYLASTDCIMTGHVFRVVGDLIGVYEGWHLVDTFENGRRWEIPGVAKALSSVPAEPVVEPPKMP
ncbi:short-chain dehydrogenase [Nocardioides sp. Root79]|uniref:SDR family NAD(P)-dependent oxidoreductase n=2 Tax=unclassified Nocardioides TaxID=2615069 RepID=UPI0007033FD3|nr:SDR family NAD(P)-dependent oxidoreductase [Nocardioides sp. Root79]KRC53106.1 short-chain dehydrogenase [Nocardioides sp. Root79]KRC72635.1 short-chain dehydrogenase [Nocardioides sp. Root240]